MKTFTLLLIFLGCSACTTSYYPKEPISFENELLKVTTDKISFKSTRYEFRGRLRNQSDKSILILFNTIECFSNGINGRPYYRLGIGERFINLAAGSTKDWKFDCRFERPIEQGGVELKINSVFSNPSNDGRTQGELIAKDLKFSIK